MAIYPALRSLLKKHEAKVNEKSLVLISQMSLAAWQHILLNGHYTFHNEVKPIN